MSGPATPSPPSSGSLLGDLSWEALADGRTHRLKRGKHFKVGVRTLQSEAGRAAEALGKGVRTVRDELGKRGYLWVQFADQELPLGAPCGVCGSLELLQLHEHFGACPACGASIVFKGVLEDDPEPPPPPPPLKLKGRRPREVPSALEAFSEVRVRLVEEDEEHELWRGQAIDEQGERVLVLLEYKRDETGERLKDDKGRDRYTMRAWPAEPFADALDLEALDGDEPSPP